MKNKREIFLLTSIILVFAILGCQPSTSPKVDAGAFYTCAVDQNGKTFCWGNIAFGDLCVNSVPIHDPCIVRIEKIKDISTGFASACAILQDGKIKCWGRNYTFNTQNPEEVTGLPSKVSGVAVGAEHICVINDRDLTCLGKNNLGQLGDGTLTDSSTPVKVKDLSSGLKAIAAGNKTTCALTDHGDVKCWGDNFGGALGIGSYGPSCSEYPVDVINLNSDVVSITSFGTQTCILTNAGAVRCWGWDSWAPKDVVGLTSDVRAVEAGQYHACAITNVGGVKCWGRNNYGQLGDGTTKDSETPVDVTGLANGIIALAAGTHHTCALAEDGIIRCWGRNDFKQLGNGTADGSLIPVEVIGIDLIR